MAKFYVVWKGRKTGVFTSWEACEAQVKGFTGAKYKAFPSREMAKKAWQGDYRDYERKPASSQQWLFALHPPDAKSISVDAACSGNPGRLEYQGVATADGKALFHCGPYRNGTNNVGEFLAIVHALTLLKENDSNVPVYSDSETAIAWVKAGNCNTDLRREAGNAPLFELLEGAETWLALNPKHSPVLKWDTRAWGEIPADFNRK